mmetsp:Transcript_10827/g.31020  ORF Transcript_10827/g.31020 Transcript_10827/m.31020 type:complete len:309 (-) Transcript_10827:575-1501(-)
MLLQPTLERSTESVKLVHYPRSRSVEVGYVPFVVDQFELLPKPPLPRRSVVGCLRSMSFRHILPLHQPLLLGIPKLCRLESHGVHDSFAVGYRRCEWQLSGIEQVVVYALVVAVNFKAALLLLDPRLHFSVHHFQVLDHGRSRADRRARAQHRLLVSHVLAFLDWPVGEPVLRRLILVLFKHLQSLDDRRSRSERITLEDGIAHVHDQDGPRARGAFLQPISLQRKSTPARFDVSVRVSACSLLLQQVGLAQIHIVSAIHPLEHLRGNISVPEILQRALADIRRNAENDVAFVPCFAETSHKPFVSSP